MDNGVSKTLYIGGFETHNCYSVLGWFNATITLFYFLENAQVDDQSFNQHSLTKRETVTCNDFTI